MWMVCAGRSSTHLFVRRSLRSSCCPIAGAFLRPPPRPDGHAAGCGRTHQMKELVRLGVFLLFLGLGARVALARPPVRKRWVNLLLGYVLCVSTIVGVTQRDVWPFSAYR